MDYIFKRNRNNKKVGEIIQEERKKRGLTQEDVAKKLFVSRQTILKWEKDESMPDIYKLRDLSDVFNCDIGHLVGEYAETTREINDVCEKTHLSENAIKNLVKYDKNSSIIEVINRLLESERFIDLLQCIYEYKKELPTLDTEQANFKLYNIEREFIGVVDNIKLSKPKPLF